GAEPEAFVPQAARVMARLSQTIMRFIFLLMARPGPLVPRGSAHLAATARRPGTGPLVPGRRGAALLGAWQRRLYGTSEPIRVRHWQAPEMVTACSPASQKLVRLAGSVWAPEESPRLAAVVLGGVAGSEP